jgi:hypothetical protein
LQRYFNVTFFRRRMARFQPPLPDVVAVQPVEPIQRSPAEIEAHNYDRMYLAALLRQRDTIRPY